MLQPGTTTELNLADYFRSKNIKFKPVVIEKLEEVLNAYFAGRCDVYTTDVSGLIAARASRAANAADHVILPEVISKEPLGPAVRHGDDHWFDLVKWSLFAMIDAEELGLSSKNIDQQEKSANPVVQRFAGASGEFGKMLGVDKRWAYNIIRQVGNYGESFERNLIPLGVHSRRQQTLESRRAHVRAAAPLRRIDSAPIEFDVASIRARREKQACVALTGREDRDSCSRFCRCPTGLAAWYFVSNAARNLLALGVSSGFGFLTREAGFEIGETTILSYSAADTYLKALAVGILNTLRVAALAMLFSTLVGAIVGSARLSRNWLLGQSRRSLCRSHPQCAIGRPAIFLVRGYYRGLPAPADALNPLPGVFLSNRGMAFPMLVSVLPFELEYSRFSGFNFAGGGSLSPEFTALLLGLSLYTAAFIAEIFRAGFLSVDRGQSEAGYSLGLSHRQVRRFIIAPQALRLIVPPITSQYLNCTKNSSLAVAIGYPDLVSIANTTINQTGQAIEGFLIIMAVYLTISLAISGFMNGYNRRVALRGATA